MLDGAAIQQAAAGDVTLGRGARREPDSGPPPPDIPERQLVGRLTVAPGHPIECDELVAVSS